MIMHLTCTRRGRLPRIIAFILLAAVATPSGQASSISWGKNGAFEACLESTMETWLASQAELVVVDDAVARALNDAVVHGWTLHVLAQCRARAGDSGQASAEKFQKHMAQWRQHIYDLAEGIRRKGQPD
jgi:hypothetical protein